MSTDLENNAMTDLDTVPTTAVALEPAPPATPYDAAWRLAQKIAGTDFVPRALRGNPHAVLACILTGEELGIGGMKSLQSIHIIEGRPTLSAELMRALVYAGGHTLDIIESTNQRVALYGRRRGGSQAKVVWTIADAQQAKLTGNPSWTKYPRAMLLARATSELCRMLFPDVIGGLYTPEEAMSIEGKNYDAGAEHGAVLVNPVAVHDIIDADDEADAVWVAEARGIDTDTGEIVG